MLVVRAGSFMVGAPANKEGRLDLGGPATDQILHG
jgi:hypothetical protein